MIDPLVLIPGYYTGMETNMQNQYTAVIKQDGKWWIGWIEELPGVNCQEATVKR